jgi:hypothetical protein
LNCLGGARNAVIKGIVVDQFAESTLAGPDARDDSAGVLGHLARCCSNVIERGLSCNDDLIDMDRGFSDRLRGIRDVAFDYVNCHVDGCDRFPNLGQEIANLEGFFTWEGASRRCRPCGTNIDLKELVSE